VLNLAPHHVRAPADAKSTVIHCAAGHCHSVLRYPLHVHCRHNDGAMASCADVRGYSCLNGHFFSLLHLHNSFPSEDPLQTPHLSACERQRSIFWRFLRPEFVRSYPVSLSPDGLRGVADRTGLRDGREHDHRLQQATQHLVRVVVPAFAARLAAIGVKAVVPYDGTASAEQAAAVEREPVVDAEALQSSAAALETSRTAATVPLFSDSVAVEWPVAEPQTAVARKDVGMGKIAASCRSRGSIVVASRDDAESAARGGARHGAGAGGGVDDGDAGGDADLAADGNGDGMRVVVTRGTGTTAGSDAAPATEVGGVAEESAKRRGAGGDSGSASAAMAPFNEYSSSLPHVRPHVLRELYKLDLTDELHNAGIPVRHLGLLRSQFWRRLDRTCSVSKFQVTLEFECGGTVPTGPPPPPRVPSPPPMAKGPRFGVDETCVPGRSLCLWGSPHVRAVYHCSLAGVVVWRQ
jgi:hypothetical protein